MLRIFAFFAALNFFSGCSSINGASRRYFDLERPLYGVEDPDEVVERALRQKRMREVLYGNLKPARIIQCTLLRNQLYVALQGGLCGKEGQEIKTAALKLEKGFQADDKTFLSACDEVASSRVGRVFLATAQSYMRDDY